MYIHENGLSSHPQCQNFQIENVPKKKKKVCLIQKLSFHVFLRSTDAKKLDLRGFAKGEMPARIHRRCS